MLNTRQVRNKAHRLIVKDGGTHQEAYDYLKTQKTKATKGDLADIISKIPTSENNQKTQTLRVLFIVFLALVFLIRAADFFFAYNPLGIKETLVFSFHGIVIPTLGILGAATSRAQFYKFVGVFMILATIGTLIRAIANIDIVLFIVTIPFIGAAILAFVLSKKLETPYNKKMVQRELNGRTVNAYEYFFDTSQNSYTDQDFDLLDG